MRILLLLFTLFLVACNGSSNDINHSLTPLPGAEKDLPDSALLEPMATFITTQNAPPNSQYDLARIDLNGDGLREAITLFKNPYTHWCGWDGCGMAIFKATPQGFEPLSTISGVRGPIYISGLQSNGWKDIIIRISGTNMPAKNIVMRFDGNGYPSSPMLAPDLTVPLSSLSAQRHLL